MPAGLTACPPGGLIIAAPSSGSGKTVITLGLLRHYSRSGVSVGSAKAGPDYIDPRFHSAATRHLCSGLPCPNLDLWAMRSGTLTAAVGAASGRQNKDAGQIICEGVPIICEGVPIICEGVMGLFDGAVLENGSTADLAAHLGWPVVMIIDAARQGASAAVVLEGFARHRADVRIAGVVFNRTGGPRHDAVLRHACAEVLPDVVVLGCLPRTDDLAIPARHLGLVQASELTELEEFLDRAAGLIAKHIDTTALLELAAPTTIGLADASTLPPVAPLGQRMAIALDDAFAFTYPLVIEGWRDAGAEISFFSPLGGAGPDPAADAVYLPGGYPELHAARLGAGGFFDGLRDAAARGATVFGECGGYMVLGEGLIDGDGVAHEMAGLLPLETSFAAPRLHLGYREARLVADGPLGARGDGYRGHEFHYATIIHEGTADPLFEPVKGAAGDDRGSAGRRKGLIMGSFIHLIDRL